MDFKPIILFLSDYPGFSIAIFNLVSIAEALQLVQVCAYREDREDINVCSYEYSERIKNSQVGKLKNHFVGGQKLESLQKPKYLRVNNCTGILFV